MSKFSKANIIHTNYTQFIRSDYLFVRGVFLAMNFTWARPNNNDLFSTSENFAASFSITRERECVYLTHSFDVYDSIQKPETIHVYTLHTHNLWLVPSEHANQMIMNRIENIIVAYSLYLLLEKFFNSTNSTYCNNQNTIHVHTKYSSFLLSFL